MKCHPLGSHLPIELQYKPSIDLHTIHIFQFIEEGPCCFSRKTNLQKQNKYWRRSVAVEPCKHRCVALSAFKSDKEYSDIITPVSGTCCTLQSCPSMARQTHAVCVQAKWQQADSIS